MTTVREIEAYCTATIDILESQLPSEFGKGQIAFATKILEKVKSK